MKREPSFWEVNALPYHALGFIVFSPLAYLLGRFSMGVNMGAPKRVMTDADWVAFSLQHFQDAAILILCFSAFAFVVNLILFNLTLRNLQKLRNLLFVRGWPVRPSHKNSQRNIWLQALSWTLLLSAALLISATLGSYQMYLDKPPYIGSS